MTMKEQEFDAAQDPLLVQAEEVGASSNRGNSDAEQPDDDAAAAASSEESPALASQRQIRGAAWAGGIVGLVLGPIGAAAGAFGAYYYAKNKEGDIGDFARKAGDFTSKIPKAIKREWEQASSKRNEE